MKDLPKIILVILLTTAVALTAPAQKLPGIQGGSLRAPAIVKIDGKLSEWPANLLARNNAIGAYYTVANDTQNLYLVIQARDAQIVKKIIGGSVTFSVSPDEKMPVQAGLSFPVLNTGQKSTIGIKFNNHLAIAGKDDAGRARDADSLLSALNTEVANDMKEIKLAGMRGQTDSLLSVYNSEGFKAAINFDRQFYLNMEVAVPLAALGLTKDSPAFGYKIAVNEVNFSDVTKRSNALSGEMVTITYTPRSIAAGQGAAEAVGSTTYCKGVYTLVK